MAQKAPRDALKEAQKLENRTRLQNQSQKLGATRTKNTRYAAGIVKVDLIRVSLTFNYPNRGACVPGASAQIPSLRPKLQMLSACILSRQPTHWGSARKRSPIQALEKKAGHVPTSSDNIVRGVKSTFKRHGIVNLFAALNVSSWRSHIESGA